MATSSGSESINKSIDPNEPGRKPKSSDPGWKYAFWPDLGKRDLVQCTLCGRKLSSGIKRLKQHLAGNYGDVVMCPNVTTEIRREMSTFLNSKQKKKPQFDEMLDDETTDTSRGASNSEFHPSSGTVSKQKKAVSILDFAKPEPKQGKSVAQMIRKSPEEVIKERHEKGPRQTTIESCTITPEMKERVYMHIANFFYENGLCCSSSGCERNWSTFEFIHSKRRNRLLWKRLNDLVYVQYNRKITTRFEKLRLNENGYDPIVLEEFQWENEWVADDPLWHHVDDAMGATNANQGRNLSRIARDDLSTYRRRRTRDNGSSDAGGSFRLQDEPDDDVEMEEDNIPIDDEDLEDDYGAPSDSQNINNTRDGSSVGDDLELDDFV